MNGLRTSRRLPPPLLLGQKGGRRREKQQMKLQSLKLIQCQVLPPLPSPSPLRSFGRRRANLNQMVHLLPNLHRTHYTPICRDTVICLLLPLSSRARLTGRLVHLILHLILHLARSQVNAYQLLLLLLPTCTSLINLTYRPASLPLATLPLLLIPSPLRFTLPLALCTLASPPGVQVKRSI